MSMDSNLSAIPTVAASIPSAAAVTLQYDPARVALAIVQSMAAIDLYDYLADFGIEPEPHGDNLTKEELRIEVILDIQQTGPTLFCQRMLPRGCADALFAEED